MEKVHVHELDLHQDAWGVSRAQGRAQHKLCFLLHGPDPTSFDLLQLVKQQKSVVKAARSASSVDGLK